MGSKTNMKGHWGPGAIWTPDPEPDLETEPEEEAAEEQPQSEWEQYRTHGPDGRPIIVTGGAVRGSFQMWRTQGEGIINPASVQRVEQDPLLHRGEIRPQYLDMAATWNPPPADRWTPEYHQNPPPVHQLAEEYNRRVNQSMTPSVWYPQESRMRRGGNPVERNGPSLLRELYHAYGPFTDAERREAAEILDREMGSAPDQKPIPPTEDEINQIAERVGEAIVNAIPYSTATDVIPATEEELYAYREPIRLYLGERLRGFAPNEIDRIRDALQGSLEELRDEYFTNASITQDGLIRCFRRAINIEEDEAQLRDYVANVLRTHGSGVQPAGVAVAEGDEPAVPVPDQGEEEC